MRIIKKNDTNTNTDTNADTNADINKIVANMLNIENAYTVYNDDLSLNKDVTFFPKIDDNSFPSSPVGNNQSNPVIHYRATTGIIYYDTGVNLLLGQKNIQRTGIDL